MISLCLSVSCASHCVFCKIRFSFFFI
jgi:hypothetical protein